MSNYAAVRMLTLRSRASFVAAHVEAPLRVATGAHGRRHFKCFAAADIPAIPYTDVISSVNNNYVKHCAKLRTNRKYREELGRTLLCGQGVIEEQLAAANVQVQAVFSTDPEQLPDAIRQGTWPIITVAPHVMHKLTGLEEAAGVGAVAEICVPPKGVDRQAVANAQRVLVLDRVQDPGNLGTLLRTAAALSWDAVCLLEGCCDPYNEKAIRAARGATFQVSVSSGTWSEVAQVLVDEQFALIAAEPSARAPPNEHVTTGQVVQGLQSLKVAMVLGSEGQGVRADVLEKCVPVGIPMPGCMESLNVGVAGAMLMLAFSTALEPLLLDLGSKLPIDRQR